MYLHIGGDVIVSQQDIIAILDLETCRQGAITREFLKWAEQGGLVKKPQEEGLSRSCILTSHAIYYSPISSVALFRRLAAVKGKLAACDRRFS